MKRALPGTKSKQASPARKPAAKRPSVRAKVKDAKTPAKRRSPLTKTKPVARKARVKTPKPVQAKLAKPKTARRKNSKATTIKRTVVKSPKVKRAAPEASMTGTAKILTPAPVSALPRAKRKAAPRKVGRLLPQPRFTVPAFLLEGDEPSHPEVSGPGEKFALGPTAPLDHFAEAVTPLPESYGTGRLFLTARDPHWLYAHWDFSREEQFRHNARSVDRHLVLRVHDQDQPAAPIAEYHVHPESKHWFAHVERAGEKYVAELGYYQSGQKWKSLTTSTPQRTPPDHISADATIEFATIPLELSFEKMLALLREQADETPEQNLPLARAIESIRERTRHDFPEAMRIADWTPAQEQALAEILAADRAGLASPSSQDSAREEMDFMVASAAAVPESPSSYVSSFFGGEGQNDFWFQVNAELIVYGATEPNATVTFAGKPVPLRPDGSFRLHFALPDGNYALPVVAVSADGTDGRAAELKFTRATEVRGQVETQPQDPALNPPPPGDS
jgi:hypothetical protein